MVQQPWRTREVLVGSVGIGANNPIRIQSMTTSKTQDVSATVEQILRLQDAGCELVRVTVQGSAEAYSCEKIKNSLLQKGSSIPLIADIHFYPPAALLVADFVDKVRINPGNFADRRAQFTKIDYDDASYLEEIQKLEEKFAPLVEKCKRLKRALRIGVNHGSLSDRIMNRYGDSPQGMVESALEFARICRSHHFHDLVFSMKSSNPAVMIEAYRLLVQQMQELGWDYPLHLGVTEAGFGEEGRIKSAAGIGSLLLDGIGDTIRISLTEDPWNEIDPCKRLISFAEKQRSPSSQLFVPSSLYSRRKTLSHPLLHSQATVALEANSSADLSSILSTEKSRRADLLFLGKALPEADKSNIAADLINLAPSVSTLNDSQPSAVVRVPGDVADEPLWNTLLTKKADLLLFSATSHRIQRGRAFFAFLQKHNITTPLLLDFFYNDPPEDLLLHAAAECGALLIEGIGEGLLLRGNYDPLLLQRMSFAILQAARRRFSTTEFISCPGCGRTLFNLQQVSQQIRDRTAHLPGVKIAIMGCIVNGPGEMADADFGYVGSKAGMIDLYVGKKCVEKEIPFEEAEERLVALIQRCGKWSDPATL